MNVFFLKTIIHLGFQLTLTALTANNMRNTKIDKKWMWFFFSVGLLFAMRFTEIPLMIRLIMFCLFSVFNGFVCSSFIKYSKPKDVQSAIFYTILTFASMTICGFMFLKYELDITPLMTLICMYSVTLIISYLYMMFFDVQEKKKQYIRLASIALFTLYIVFDTYKNFGKEYDNDIVISTLDYYIDVGSIFQNILSFFRNSV